MFLQNLPIKRKLMVLLLATSSVVLVITSAAFFAYELLTFRQSIAQHLSTVGEMIAANSTFALAVRNREDAQETLSSLQAERHILAAALYDRDGLLFVTYPENAPTNVFPTSPAMSGHYFTQSAISTFQPVMLDGKPRGTLYIKADLGAFFDRMQLYSVIMIAIMLASFLVAYLISATLQKHISRPVLALVEVATAVSERQDYSVRAPKLGSDEFGLLTDTFNGMLEQIHNRDLALQEAQQKLKEHAGQLEQRVAERTARLSDTIAELESFSYSISHDMRGPLRAMQGFSTMLRSEYEQRLDETAIDYLNRIDRAAQRLDRLIQDILNYSQVAKRSETDLTCIDLRQVIQDIIQQYPGMQPPQAIVSVNAPLPSVLAHEASLVQVLSNLLANAVKFVTPGTTPQINIWAQENGPTIRLFIKDNGIGIAPEYHQKIFGMFERIDATKRYEGTGIGLAIVRTAIERMGGQVGLESATGKGSTFWIELKKG